MTARHQVRRRRGEGQAIDLEEIDPREGLRRFAFSWFTRAPAIEEPPPEEIAAPPSAEPQPPPPGPAKRKRGAKQAVEIPLRRRAFLWFREHVEGARSPNESETLRVGPGLRSTSPGRGRRSRGPKQEVEFSLRRRAFLWFQERREAAQEAGLSGSATAGGDVARAHLKGVLEAVIFASEHPLPAKELARLARAELKVVKVLLAELTAEYHPRGFRLDEIAGGYVFRTSPAFSPFVREQVAKRPVKMSRAQIETLAIVAYRQPVTRPEIDEVRGVDSGAVLKSLLERNLVRILGKKEEPGRPMLYGTTAEFLEFFGLKQLGDLPTLREFTELSDESRRAYEREMGEEPPEGGQEEQGLMGGEGELREAEMARVEQEDDRDHKGDRDGDGDGDGDREEERDPEGNREEERDPEGDREEERDPEGDREEERDPEGDREEERDPENGDEDDDDDDDEDDDDDDDEDDDDDDDEDDDEDEDDDDDSSE